MKNTIIWGLLCVLSLGAAATSQAQQASGSAEKAVLALEGQWLQSQKTNNVELLAPLLADKFVDTGADGKVTDKAGTLADAKATKWSSAEYLNMQVTVFGDTAVVTGTFKGKGTDAGGKPLDDNQRFTDTWAKMPNGKWQCVATHNTNIKM